MKTIHVPNLKKVFSNPFKKKVKARENPESDVCPICDMGMPIIYDQEQDACTTCKSIWLIKNEKKAQ